MKDMPKLESPYMRKEINGDYVVTPEINPGYAWVFEDESVMAIEKLHGTNVSIVIENGIVTSIWNRTERIIPFVTNSKNYIVKGVLESFERGYIGMLGDGQHFGELIGEKVNGNPYHIVGHLWIPFKTYAQEHLRYKSWGKYSKDFETISRWFQNDLLPLYTLRKYGKDFDKHFVEGIVFTHPDGRMAKLRRDMFDWWFKEGGIAHKE